MKLTKILANSLREVLIDGKWVTGTSIKHEIYGLDWKTATMKIDSLNSIADITFHINYYIEGVLNVFNGGKLEIKDKYSFNSKPINSSKDWQDLVDKFCNDSEKFVKAIEEMTNTTLEKTFSDKKYGNYFRNITVMSEHSYYHLGQIKLIKKLIDQKKE